VDRLACVDLPAMPLQLLLRQHPDWHALPVAVVQEDKPLGLITWVNERAFACGVRAGHRYAQGLALASDLRGGVVSPEMVAAEVDALTEALRGLAPHVEPRAETPGVFWLDASGLLRLHRSLRAWAALVQQRILLAGLQAGVVVGFRRFASYAIARAAVRPDIIVYDDPAAEAAAARRVPLARVGLPLQTCEALEKLAVYTLGDFAVLPRRGIARRFGPEALALHALARDEAWDPLRPRPPADQLAAALDLDEPEADLESLMFLLKRLLDPLLARLHARGEALGALSFRLQLQPRTLRERPGLYQEQLRPAEPTLDGGQLLGLVRLRLETLALSAGVTRLELDVTGVRTAHQQLGLFAASRARRRDLEAGARAFARLRALYGAQAVVRARLREAHLPEARVAWEPLDRIAEARPSEVARRPLVRRLLARATPLTRPGQAGRERSERTPAGALLWAKTAMQGPYVISGGWWRKQVERAYYFVKDATGEQLWVYYDRQRKRWYLQGRVA
jgi:protein ImuB